MHKLITNSKLITKRFYKVDYVRANKAVQGDSAGMWYKVGQSILQLSLIWWFR